MKLSKSELSIIFANYIGQYVLFQRDKTLRVNIFDNKFARNYTKGPRILDQWLLYALSENDFDDVKLMLRPIQTIKDEEIEVMIRVCDNFGYSYVAKVDRESDEEQIRIYCYDDNRKWNENDDDYRLIIINLENESRDYICCECGSDGSILDVGRIPQLVQWLMASGFDLPHYLTDNLELIDADIAVEYDGKPIDKKEGTKTIVQTPKLDEYDMKLLGTIVDKILDDSVTFANLNQLKKIYNEFGVDDKMIAMMLINLGFESLTEYVSLTQEEAESKKEMFAAILKAMNEPLLNKLNATV